MPHRYQPQILTATTELINALISNNLNKAQDAIANGADVSCRIIKENEGYRVATDAELKEIIREEFEGIVYELPMPGTTTLLNLLARKEIKDSNHQFAILLMENGAELNAIDYASYWIPWGNHPGHFYQNTPLLNAIAADNQGFALLYMDFLDNLPKDERKIILDYKDKFIAGDHSALQFAIRRGFSQLAIRIIKAGANVNPKPFKYAYAGGTPLHMACMMLGQSRNGNQWDLALGSDLELILTLLEYNADFTKEVLTSIYDGNKWDHKPLVTAFDYINITDENESKRIIDCNEACYAPAMSPKMRGQVIHCFHEEESFLCQRAQQLKAKRSRVNYLESPQFKQIDKEILQKAILRRIIKEYLSIYENDELRQIDFNQLKALEIVNILDCHYQREWFSSMMQYGGIIYIKIKEPAELLPQERREEIDLLEYEIFEEYKNDEDEECEPLRNAIEETSQTEPVSSSFLINLLAHPASKAVCFILVVAGIAMLTCGIAGAVLGISGLLAKTLGASGISLGLGLFATSKFVSDNSALEPEPIFNGGNDLV